MRGKNLTAISLVLMLIISLAIVNVGFTQDLTPRAYVDPPMSVVNPGVSFTVNINVENAPETGAWEFRIKWNTEVLKFPPEITEEEGSFLKVSLPDENRTADTHLTIKPNQAFGYMMVGSTLLEEVTQYGGAIPSGSGTLASVTFLVQDSGETDLELYDVKLFDYYDPSKVTIPTMESGYFHTTTPFVDFTWTPIEPDVGEMTFNASASYDPDGGDIVSYEWEFGDGSGAWGPKETIVKHTYRDYSFVPYPVTLTLTDDDGDVWSKTKDLRIWRDISMVDIWFDTSWYLDKAKPEIARGANALILLTAVNMGTKTETFNVTLTMTNDVTGEEAYVETWWSNPRTLGPISGSGFTLWAGYFYTGEPAGYYTMTTEAIGFAEEPEKANNVLSKSIRLTEADLIADSVSVSVDGNTMTLSGRAKNLESLATPTAGLYTWLRFEVTDENGNLVVVDTDAEFVTNEEETDVLTASMEVGPGDYSVTAYAVYSTLSQSEVEFYEQFAWPGALEGTSETTRDYTFTIPGIDLKVAKPKSRVFKISPGQGNELTFYGAAKNTVIGSKPTVGIYAWVHFEVLTPEGDLVLLDTPAEYIENQDTTGLLSVSMNVSAGTYSVTAYAVYSYSPQDDVSMVGYSERTRSFTVLVKD